MENKTRGFRNRAGPYSEGMKKRKRARAICPFDKESVEDVKNMKVKKIFRVNAKVVNDELGKRRFIK